MKTLLILLLILISAAIEKANAANYYFSSSEGDDSRTSAQAQNSSTPWRSIDKLNSIMASLQPGDQVLFKRGDIFYGSISVTKSGTVSSPITFGTYGSGARPVITGFTTVSSWTSVGNGLYEASVSTSLPALNIVTLDGAFQAMGKYPKGNSGYLTVSSGSTSSISSSGLSGIPNFTGGEVVWRPYHWVFWRGTVSSQSSASVSFTAFPSTSGGGTEAPQANYGFFFQNHPNACTSLGEWAYNSSTHKLTMYFGATGPGSYQVQATTIQDLVVLGGQSFIIFNDLNFRGANTNLFNLNSSSNITIQNCELFGGGVYGVFANGNSPSLKITNSRIDRCNSIAIRYSSGSVGGVLTTDTITNTATVPGMGGSGEGEYFGVRDIKNGAVVTNCVITNTGYVALCFQGTNNTIQNNYIDTFCTIKDDGGGIYCGGQSFSGSKVINNIVFNGIGASIGTPDKESRAQGIYVDDGGSNVEITGNTVAFSGEAGIYVHNGHDLNIHDNTSFDNKTMGIKYYNDGNTIANVNLSNNIFFAKTAAQLVSYSSGGSTSASKFFATADNNLWCRPLNENNNFQTLSSSLTNYNLAGWKTFTGKEANSKVTPIVITDAKNIRFEYNASPSSKTVNLGATYMDVKGKNYTGSITLVPYTSIILLYVSGTVTNQLPVANAGTDQNFSLPTNSTTLTGSGTDSDGSIASYQWAKISGPTQYTIASSLQAKTNLSGLAEGVYQFELTVTDNSGGIDKDTIQITVTAAANQPPIAKAGNTQAIALPTNSVVLDGSSSTDNDGAIASYSWTKISGPSSAVILAPDQATSDITTLTQGTYQFELKVTDNQGAIGKDTVQITVSAALNELPVANAGPDINITLPTNSATLSGSGNDPDGTIASLQWTKISGPSQYTFTSSTQTQTSVNNLAQGIYKFELKITDNSGGIDRDTTQVTVNAAPINQLPTANAGLDINLTLPTNSVTLSGSANDPDGTIASYQWTKISGPSQYTILLPTGLQTTVNNLTQGIYKFELTVTDNAGAIDKDSIQVTVNAAPVNQPPVANAGLDITITLPTNSVTLSGNANDPDGNIASYQWRKILGPAQYNIVTPSQSQTTVSNLAQGIYKFELTSIDNAGANDKDTIQVTVNTALNQTPSANAGADQIITLPTNSITLSGSGNDPDGSITSYQWKKISGPNQYNIGSSTSAKTTVTNLAQGIYQFELRVTDNQGAIGKDTINVTVNEAAPLPNLAPKANAGSDVSITLPTNSARLMGNGTDPDGKISAYQWASISGPKEFTINSPTRALTTISNLVQGVYNFQLTVTDNRGATAKDTVQVTVYAASPVNKAPTANAGDDINITLPINSVTLSGNGNDPDGSIASFGWQKISGPAQYTIVSPTQAQTSLNDLLQGVYKLELTVTDNSGTSARDTIQITVNAAPAVNQAPAANAGSDVNITLPTNSVVLSGSGNDPDGSITSFGWQKISGPSQYTIASPNQAQTSFDDLVEGIYQLELTVTDNSGASTKDTVQITVNAAAAIQNKAPKANAGSDKNVTLPTNSVTLSGNGSDPDGIISSYKWKKVSGPTSNNIVSATTAQTTVSNLAQGIYQFELTVTDDLGASAKDTIKITVSAAAPPPNNPPTANAGLDINLTLPTNSIILTGAGKDADGTIASYQWAKISGPASYNIVSPTKAQTTVNDLAEGIYKFELTVTDNAGAIAKDTLQVTVNAAPMNILPMANAGGDLHITLPTDSVILSGKGVDADGTITLYQWKKIAGPTQYTIVSSKQSQTLVKGLEKGVYQFELTVTDNAGATAKDTINVTVSEAPLSNQLPTANAGADIQIVLPTDSSMLSGKGTDADGRIVSYEWVKVSGPSQYTIASPAKAQTPISDLTPGVYQFELTVTDNKGATAKDTVELTVNEDITSSTAKVFPNPATDVINIQINAVTSTSNTSIRIYNNQGNLVYQEDFVRPQQRMVKQINVSKLQRGIYFAELQTDTDKIINLRFIKM